MLQQALHEVQSASAFLAATLQSIFEVLQSATILRATSLAMLNTSLNTFLFALGQKFRAKRQNSQDFSLILNCKTNCDTSCILCNIVCIATLKSFLLARQDEFKNRLYSVKAGFHSCRKISMGSDRIGTKLTPRMSFRYQFLFHFEPMIL